MINESQDKMPSELEKLLSKAERRLEELKGILPSEVSREKVSMISKTTLKAYAIHAGLLHRTADLAEASIDLFKKSKNLSAFVLTRSVLETVALFYYFWCKLEGALKSGKAHEADDIFMRILFGARNTKDGIESINILTAVDRLDKDAAGIRDMYDDLCELAHPNWMGTVGNYGDSGDSPFTLYFDQEHEGVPPEAALPLVSELLAALSESNDTILDMLQQFKTLHEEEYTG